MDNHRLFREKAAFASGPNLPPAPTTLTREQDEQLNSGGLMKETQLLNPARPQRSNATLPPK
jgi:hypothetical protein